MATTAALWLPRLVVYSPLADQDGLNGERKANQTVALGSVPREEAHGMAIP